MASIPSNGYNEVMSGSNNYTGTNSFDGSCPQTPNPPTVPNDLTNKLYIDTLIGPPSGVGLSQILTVSNNGGTQDITNVKTYDTTSPASGGSTAFNGTYRARGLGFGSDLIMELTGYGVGRPVTSSNSSFDITNNCPSQNIDIGTTNNVAIGGIKGRVSVNTALIPNSIVDSLGSQGTNGQVLVSRGTGAPYGAFNPQNLEWTTIAPAGITSIAAGTNIDVAGTPTVPIIGLDSPLTAPLDVGSQDITSTTSAIDITPLAGQDINVNVSGAGALHAVQTSAGGTTQPIARFNNNNGSAGAVTIRTNKTGKNAATGDVIASLQFNSRNFSAVDTTFAKIECSATTATVGDTDGSIDFYTNINTPNNNQLVFRLNGADNENNTFRPLDLNGNALKTSSGNMTLDTTASVGTGTLIVASKAATTITSTTGGINLTANGGGTIQANTSGSVILAASTQATITTNTGIFNINQELHYGKISTLYPNQIYRPVYQPYANISPLVIPTAEINQEGQQVILVNSVGDGSNELTVISTPNFTATCMEYILIAGSPYYVAGGYNNIDLRPEIRFGGNINDVFGTLASLGNGYVAIPALPSGRINCLCYDPVLIPDRIAFGGVFQAVSGVSEYRTGNAYISSVSNLLVLDISNFSTIAPIDMYENPVGAPFTGEYGVDGEVFCCGTRAYDNTNYPPASAPFYIFGGAFSGMVGGGGSPALNQICFIPNGAFAPLGIRYFMIGGASSTITMIVNDDAGQIVMGGTFSNIGTSAVDYLAYTNPLLLPSSTYQPFGSSPPYPPPYAPSVGKALFGWFNGSYVSGSTFYVGTSFGGLNSEVYQGDLNNHTAGLTLVATSLPATPRGLAIDLGVVSPTLNFIVGWNVGGGDNYCYEVPTPHLIDLNGSVYMTNTFYDPVSIPNLPLFFKDGSQSTVAPAQYSIETPSGAGQLIVNTTPSYPFIDPTQPTKKWSKITLAAENNFATGTVVGYGTDDARILILSSTGASFSN